MKLVYGPWGVIYYCHGCGKHDEYRHNVNPCTSCGENDYSAYTARTFRHSFLSKLVNLCMLRATPPSGWEYKYDAVGRGQPPMPKRKQHIPKSRLAQLELQTELIELLPDKFDVYLMDDKVLVKRLDEKVYDPLS